MDKNLTEIIGSVKLVPVIKLNDPKDAIPLVDALVAGGLSVAEITFRTAAAPEAIALVRKERPDVLVGAGTVLTIEQAQKAIDSGASFVVSPGFNPTVVDYCIEKGMPVFPGVTSPTEVEMGLARGLKVLKFFPAEASGGVAMLKALGAVYEVRFMPTGGVSDKNVLSYLALKNVIACGGSWMVSPELIESGKFDEITEITRKAVELVKGL
ncbi:bifunctional 4-hydroxy-2-oxoglutarate aldolase/2-dehydro-3-deoxy-phosphogluconate aldolase [Pleomorphochaeta sp. DL1XJH-081]|jgi:2-dehydro-3-deoxyphosphogluconate aldolase/(4S)-4-hydroxy-2-oxoglutarate aldolase|uniref:bifunctional 4-hydroxy-2-oxoglutarate aldolase/2-dehydro-3-deoxy-phosphogluconate aldolase n=1 Tax=Pleomorphochaeta sp. DL1XJH-081 TaxID=3409690 RepID=UPI003BB68725